MKNGQLSPEFGDLTDHFTIQLLQLCYTLYSEK